MHLCKSFLTKENLTARNVRTHNGFRLPKRQDALQLHRLDLLANDETDENLPPRFRSLEDYGTDIL